MVNSLLATAPTVVKPPTMVTPLSHYDGHCYQAETHDDGHVIPGMQWCQSSPTTL